MWCPKFGHFRDASVHVYLSLTSVIHWRRAGSNQQQPWLWWPWNAWVQDPEGSKEGEQRSTDPRLQASKLTYSRNQPQEAEELRKASRALTAAPPSTSTVHPRTQENKEICLSKEVLIKLQRRNFKTLPREGIIMVILSQKTHVQWYRLGTDWPRSRSAEKELGTLADKPNETAAHPGSWDGQQHPALL